MLADQQHVNATQSELYQKTVADLRQELDDARTQLKESKDKVSEPSSLLLHLQKELLSVKVLSADFLTVYRVATSLENLEVSENLTAVREIWGNGPDFRGNLLGKTIWCCILY